MAFLLVWQHQKGLGDGKKCEIPQPLLNIQTDRSHFGCHLPVISVLV